jgi:hypothetical protein
VITYQVPKFFVSIVLQQHIILQCDILCLVLVGRYLQLDRNYCTHIRAYLFSSITHIHFTRASSFSALLRRPTRIVGISQDQYFCWLLARYYRFPSPNIHNTLTMLLPLSYHRHNRQASLKCWCLSTTYIILTAVRISYFNFRKYKSKFYHQPRGLVVRVSDY